ncbi:hypothetical protein Lepto7376_0454 [[Leptolyngbya] sp. PCC 7376]|uniref:hypothetical protein n=1 Tax=[Leptolyngbya] sp. PCC 7376 TaxID=111781 RepID=UPI00029F0C16|nr:hypothetical protein [[Leptolyngbya] sp. PCC 7376]AFY36887.1 hypothetical protein Lepto7376_0454 [[Leptolyngbya] sp. PCC 7376]
MEEKQKLVITLEENALDSLVHGIEHYLHGKRKSDWKYTILHVFHAVELMLKARLAKYDEKLIYSNRKNGHTINCSEAVKRLIDEANIPLSGYIERISNSKKADKHRTLLSLYWKKYCVVQNTPSLKDTLLELCLLNWCVINLDKHVKFQKVEYQFSRELEELRQSRNNIEHKEVEISKSDVESFLGVAFRFLDDFVSLELGISLSEKLEELDELRINELIEAGVSEENIQDQDSYKTLSLAFLSYIHSLSDQGIPLHPKRRVDHTFYTCELCSEEAVVLPDPRTYSMITHCYNCRSKYKGYICSMCDQFYLEYMGEWEKGECRTELSEREILQILEDDDVSFCPACQDRIIDL